MAGRVLASRAPLIVDDLSTIELASPMLRDSGLRSTVAVPMVAGDAILGVLHVDSLVVGHFGPSDADMLAILANRLAAAIERVRLFEAERAARGQAELVGTRLRRLHSVTAELSKDLGIEEVADVVVAQVAPAFGAEAVSTLLLSPYRQPSRSDERFTRRTVETKPAYGISVTVTNPI